MNLIEQSERLKGAPDQFLAQEAQAPSGFAPPYLILAEIGRRQQLRQKGAAKAPTTTVYDDLVGQAGLPTMEALGRPGASPMAPMPAAQRPPMQHQQPPGPPQVGIAGAAPMRYHRGGVVRMAWGGGVYGAPTGGYDYPFLREAMDRQKFEEEERKRQMLLMSGAGAPPGTAGTTMIRGIPFPAVPAPAQRNLPPLVAPTIKEPQLAPVLQEIRGMRTPTAELTAPLEQRIAELEAQRSSIERPSFRNALFETGLGMMASRAPTALGALGQAGLGALQNYRAMKQQARAEGSDISKQIGQAGAQIAGMRGHRSRKNSTTPCSACSSCMARKSCGPRPKMRPRELIAGSRKKRSTGKIDSTSSSTGRITGSRWSSCSARCGSPQKKSASRNGATMCGCRITRPRRTSSRAKRYSGRWLVQAAG